MLEKPSQTGGYLEAWRSSSSLLALLISWPWKFRPINRELVLEIVRQAVPHFAARFLKRKELDTIFPSESKRISLPLSDQVELIFQAPVYLIENSAQEIDHLGDE